MAETEETRCLVGVSPETPGFYKPDTPGFYEPDTRGKNKSAKEKKAAKAKAKKAAEAAAAAATAAKKAAESAARQKARRKEAESVIPCGYKAMKAAVDTASGEEDSRRLLECGAVIGYPMPFVLPDETTPHRGCNWLRLLPFPRPDPEPIRSMKAVKARYDEFLRWKMPRSQLRALNHKIVLQCLEWYNSKYPDDEYEPAPGVVTRCSEFNKCLMWTHGNFVARRKRSGCLSFLPAPRTLFFFELLDRDGFSVEEVITCTPIDEPVTEAYTFLGFPLGWGTRRRGGADCVCKTCYRQFHVPRIGSKRTCACGDSKVESVCKMCYPVSDVLHPIRGGFTFGQENFTKIFL